MQVCKTLEKRQFNHGIQINDETALKIKSKIMKFMLIHAYMSKLIS